MRVDPFKVFLRGRVRVAMSVSRDLARVSVVMVGYSSPPDNGVRAAYSAYAVVNRTHVFSVLDLDAHVAVPAFDQVDEIEKNEEGNGYEGVSVLAWAVLERDLLFQVVRDDLHEARLAP